jgi:hypothetical protein
MLAGLAASDTAKEEETLIGWKGETYSADEVRLCIRDQLSVQIWVDLDPAEPTCSELGPRVDHALHCLCRSMASQNLGGWTVKHKN